MAAGVGKCSICQSPNLAKINAALMADRPSISDIALAFGVGRMSITRHRDGHLPAFVREMEAAQAADEIVQGIADALPTEAAPRDRLEALFVKAESLMAGAEKKRDYGTAIKALREMRGCVELMLKVAGEIDQTTVNVFAGPAWLTMQTGIVAALDPYPEARAAVLLVLGPG